VTSDAVGQWRVALGRIQPSDFRLELEAQMRRLSSGNQFVICGKTVRQ
jgi:hypothetical protein